MRALPNIYKINTKISINIYMYMYMYKYNYINTEVKSLKLCYKKVTLTQNPKSII